MRKEKGAIEGSNTVTDTLFNNKDGREILSDESNGQQRVNCFSVLPRYRGSLVGGELHRGPVINSPTHIVIGCIFGQASETGAN